MKHLSYLLFLLLLLTSFNDLASNPVRLPKEKGGEKPTPTKRVILAQAYKSRPKLLGIKPLLSKKDYVLLPTTFSNNKLINKNIGPDLFMFTATANKDSVAVGEEFELTVRVEWVDFGHGSAITFLPQWYKYALKVVMPDGFIQTGGNYVDLCSEPVNADNSRATFTIKGKFEHTPSKPVFTILRGFEGSNEKSEFIYKGEALINLKNVEGLSKDTVCACSGGSKHSARVDAISDPIDMDAGVTSITKTNSSVSVNFWVKNISSTTLSNIKGVIHIGGTYSDGTDIRDSVGNGGWGCLKNNSDYLSGPKKALMYSVSLSDLLPNEIKSVTLSFDKDYVDKVLAASGKKNVQLCSILFNHFDFAYDKNGVHKEPCAVQASFKDHPVTIYKDVLSAPDNVSATPSSICVGNESKLSGTCLVGNLQWYSDEALTQPTSDVVKPRIKTSYYGACKNSTSNCLSPSRQIDVTIASGGSCGITATIKNNTLGGVTSFCTQGTISLEVTGCPDNNLVRWYADGTELVGGKFSVLSGRITRSSTFGVNCIDPNDNSEFGWSQITFTVSPLPAPKPTISPDAPVVTRDNPNVTLTANGCSGTDMSVKWFTTGGDYLATGVSYSATRGGYYAKCIRVCDGSSSEEQSDSKLVQYQETCSTNGIAPILSNNSGSTTFCASGVVNLSVSGCYDNNMAKWYNTSGNHIATGSTFSTTINSNQTFGVACQNHCTPSENIGFDLVHFVVNPYNTCHTLNPEMVNQTAGGKTEFCGVGQISIRASGCPDANKVQWWVGNGTFTGAQYTANITSNTTASFRCLSPVDDQPIGPQKFITFVVKSYSDCSYSAAIINNSTNKKTVFCKKGMIDLIVSGCPDNNRVAWYTDGTELPSGQFPILRGTITRTSTFGVNCINPNDNSQFGWNSITFVVDNSGCNANEPVLVNNSTNQYSIFCKKGGVDLEVTGCTDNSKAKWYKNGSFASIGDTYKEVISQTSTYSVVCSDETASNSATTTIQVWDFNGCYMPSIVNLTSKGQSDFCGSGALKLIMTGCGTNNRSVYYEGHNDDGTSFNNANGLVNGNWELIDGEYQSVLNYNVVKSGYFKAFCKDDNDNINWGSEQRFTFKVNPIPSVVAANIPACVSTPFILDATVPISPSNTGNVSFEWRNAAGVVVSRDQNTSIVAMDSQPNIYTVTFTDNKGCTATSSTTVTNYSLPTVTVPDPILEVCEGSAVTLQANASASAGKAKIRIKLTENTSMSDRTTTFTLSGSARPSQNTFTIVQKGKTTFGCAKCNGIEFKEGQVLGYRSENQSQKGIIKIINGCPTAWWTDLNQPIFSDWVYYMQNKTLSNETMLGCLTFENIQNCTNIIGCDQGSLTDFAQFSSQGGEGKIEIDVATISGTWTVSKSSNADWVTLIGTDLNSGSNLNTTSVTGGSLISYDWYKNNLAVNSVIPSAQLSDAGTYTVKATDARNCVGTATVDLVIPAIYITNIPQSPSVCSGTTFNYTPEGNNSNTTYTWTRRAVVGVSNPTASGNTPINEALVNTTTSPVVVTYSIIPSFNSCTGEAVDLLVTVNPSLDQATLHITGNGSNSVTANVYPNESFTLEANACSDCFVEWYENKNGNYQTFDNTGATSIQLKHANSGTYQYKIIEKGSGCSLNSFSNLVTINVINCPPIAIQQSSPVYICKDGRVTLSVSSTQHGDGIHYQWFEQIKSKNGETVNTPTVSSSTFQVGYGNYIVKSCPNGNGEYYGESIPVSVKQVPVIADISTLNTTVSIGSTVDLIGHEKGVDITGQNISYTWNDPTQYQLKGVKGVGSSGLISHHVDSVLNITNYQASNNGVYTMRVSKTIGDQTCIDESSVEIYANPSACTFDFDGDPIAECENDQGKITVNLKDNIQGGLLSYRANGGSWQASPIFQNLSDGRYVIEVKETSGGSDQGASLICRAKSGGRAIIIRCNPQNPNRQLPTEGDPDAIDCALVEAVASKDVIYSEYPESVTLSMKNCPGSIRWRAGNGTYHQRPDDTYYDELVVRPTQTTFYIAECQSNNEQYQPCVDGVTVYVNSSLCDKFSVSNTLYISSGDRTILTSKGCDNGTVHWYQIFSNRADEELLYGINVSGGSNDGPVVQPTSNASYKAVCEKKIQVGESRASTIPANCTKFVNVNVGDRCAAFYNNIFTTYKNLYKPNSYEVNPEVIEESKKSSSEKSISIDINLGDSFSILEKLSRFKLSEGFDYRILYKDNQIIRDKYQAGTSIGDSFEEVYEFSNSRLADWKNLTKSTTFTLVGIHDPFIGSSWQCEKQIDVHVNLTKPVGICDNFKATSSASQIIIGQPVTLIASGATDGVTWWQGSTIVGTGNSVIVKPYESTNTYVAKGIVKNGWRETCEVAMNVEVLPIGPIQCTPFDVTVSDPIIGTGYNATSTILIQGCENGAYLKLTGGFPTNTSISNSIVVRPTERTEYEVTCYLGSTTQVKRVTVDVAVPLTIVASTLQVGYASPIESTITVSGCNKGVFSWISGTTGSLRSVVVRPIQTTTYTGKCVTNGATITKSVTIQYNTPYDCSLVNLRAYDVNNGSGTKWLLNVTGCEAGINGGGTLYIRPETGENTSIYRTYRGTQLAFQGIEIPKNRTIRYYVTCSVANCTSLSTIDLSLNNTSYEKPVAPEEDISKILPDCSKIHSTQQVFNERLGGDTGMVTVAGREVEAHLKYNEQTWESDKLFIVDYGCSNYGGIMKWWNSPYRNNGSIGNASPRDPSIVYFELPSKSSTVTYYGRCYYREFNNTQNINRYCDVTLNCNISLPSNGSSSSFRLATSETNELPLSNFVSSITGVNSTSSTCGQVSARGKIQEYITVLLQQILKNVNCSTLTFDQAKSIILNIKNGFDSDDLLQQYPLSITNIDAAAQALVTNCSSTGASNAAYMLTADLITVMIDAQTYDEVVQKLPEQSKVNIGYIAITSTLPSCNTINWSEKLFVSPDGRPIKLPTGAKPVTYNFSAVGMKSPPVGTLEGFLLADGTADGTYYYANMTDLALPFQGYKQWKGSRVIEDNDPIYQNLLNRNATIVYIDFDKRVQGNNATCSRIYMTKAYQFDEHPQIRAEVINLTSTGGSIICENPANCPIIDDGKEYAESLKKQLGKYHIKDDNGNIIPSDVMIVYQKGNNIFNITDKSINDSQTKGTKFGIVEDSKGNLNITAEFNATKCADCAISAKRVFDEAIAAYKAKNGGSIKQNTLVINQKTPILSGVGGSNGGIFYQPMTIKEALVAIAHGYNSMVEKARVPIEVWQNPANNDFPVKDKTGIISGSMDGVAENLVSTAQLGGQLVEVGLTVISNPDKTMNDLADFVKSSQFDWSHSVDLTKTLAIGLGQGVIGYDPDEFNKGGEYSLHASGKVAGTIAYEVATGGGLFLMVKNAGKNLDDLIKEILEGLSKNWSAVDKTKFIQVFTYSTKEAQQKSMAILAEFKSGSLRADASKILWEWGNLSNKLNIQTNLSNIANKLAGIDINGTPVTIEMIADVFNNKSQIDNAEGLIQQMSNALDANDIDGFKAALKGKITFTKTAQLGLPSTLTPPPSVTQALLDARKAAQQTLQDLKSTGNALKDKVKDETQKIIKASEDMAETLSDWHFVDGLKLQKVEDLTYGSGKSGFFDRLYKDTNGNWIVVECKGGSSPLKGRKALDNTYNQQGTKQYIQSIIANMRANELKFPDPVEARKLINELENAVNFRNGKSLKSYELRQKFTSVQGSPDNLGATILSEIELID
jgi:hypothetical protein